MYKLPGYGARMSVMPYGICGAISALMSGAMAVAIDCGTVLSAPLLMKPCASRVPTVKITVLIFAGTSAPNSFQFNSSIMRDDGELEEGCCATTIPGISANKISNASVTFMRFLLGKAV